MIFASSICQSSSIRRWELASINFVYTHSALTTHRHCSNFSSSANNSQSPSSTLTSSMNLAKSSSASAASTAVTAPQYYNYSTIRSMAGSTGMSRLRRISSNLSCGGGGILEDGLPNDNYTPVDENDPYKHIRIFRKDQGDLTGRSMQLSVNLPVKKFLESFCDYDAKRCKLCNETFVQWSIHNTGIPHSGREGILLEFVRAHCGTPEEILNMWWYRLHHSPEFARIKELSHDNSYIRKKRIMYILQFLKDRKIIFDTFHVQQSSSPVISAGRSWEFERLEFIGDNVVKCVFNNRLNCIFPVHEGGTRGKVCNFQFVIDGNDGLARVYDYLEMQTLTESDRVVSKFKSDVIECLFGELQLYLWATQMQEGIYSYNLPFSNEMYPVRALVEHAMEELAHVMFMYHLEYVLGSLHRIMREHQITLSVTEPVSRTDRNSSNALSQLLNQHKHSSLSTSNMFSNNNNVNNNNNKIESSSSLLSSVYGTDKKESMTSKSLKSVGLLSGNIAGTLNPIKIAHSTHSSGSALYLESTNYDNFARVVPIARLLNSPKVQLMPSSNLSECTQSCSTVYNNNENNSNNNNVDDKKSNRHQEYLAVNENICTSKISSLCSVMRDVQLQQRIRFDWPTALLGGNNDDSAGNNTFNKGSLIDCCSSELNGAQNIVYDDSKSSVMQLSPVRSKQIND